MTSPATASLLERLSQTARSQRSGDDPRHANGEPHLRGEVAKVIELLGQQLELYRQLGELSVQQRKCLDGDAVDKLLAVLTRRQELIDELMALNNALEPHRSLLGARWKTLTLDEQACITPLLDEIETMVQTILDQDGRDRQTLASAQRKVGSDLQQLSSAGRVRHAYRGAAGPAAANRFTDQRG